MLCLYIPSFTGSDIGQNLVKAGCLSFFGYNREAAIAVGHLRVFVECANFGIIKILEGKTMRMAFEQMKQNYDQQIDKIYLTDFFVASVLMENRDGMVLLGTDSHTINDFSN